MLNKKALSATAGAPKVFVEDVFSCFLYTGNGSTQTITNGIDLSGEGGLVWIKSRTVGRNHRLTDTVRGATKMIMSNTTDAEQTESVGLTAFNNNGFSVGDGTAYNSSNESYASWTFRKAEKFFDVVTWSGNTSSSNRRITHNLGATPAVIIIKNLSNDDSWYVYTATTGVNGLLTLNTTDSVTNGGNPWSTVAPTSTDFGYNENAIGNSGNWVGYLFASNAGGFGDAGSDSIIKCGSYTGNGSSTGPTVTLDWEPQWLMIKRTDSAYGWFIADNMREMSYGNYRYLIANTSDAESASGAAVVKPLATGFQLGVTDAEFNASGGTYIYIAIRRGPMKTPTTGTSVFAIDTRNSTSGAPKYKSGFVTDMNFNTIPNGAGNDRNFEDRLRGQKRLLSNSTSAESAGSSNTTWDYMNGWGVAESSNADQYSWMFRRAPGFFDVVCWTSTGTDTVSHNLKVAPELIIRKRRNSSGEWEVYASPLGAGKYLLLNQTASEDTSTLNWQNTTPTSSVFYSGNTINTGTYVAYLFASLSGVSKIGSYTGNGSSVTVTTNFQPRFILVKRTDSTGDWIVSDSARGLVAGNDPYLELNTTDAEVTNEDWVDISSTSFTVNQTTNNANVNTGTYLYLAIA